jgi:hypothetical protein
MISRKVFLGLMLATLLVGTLASVFNIQLVKASGTIYIRSDGSIDPSTAPVQRNGDTYTLISNIACDSDGIIVERNNIVIDGNGYELRHLGYALGVKGVLLEGVTNVKVMNIKVISADDGGFSYGLYLRFASNCFITTSEFGACDSMFLEEDAGVRLDGACDNVISANSIGLGYMPELGLVLDQTSNGNRILGNSLRAWGSVFVVRGSHYNTVYDNNIGFASEYGGAYVGIDLRQGGSSNNIFYSNNIQGNLIVGVVCSSVSSYNRFYHNNFIHNNIYPVGGLGQAYDDGSTNIWDDGYPSGGNYWCDYTCIDANDDGIGDTPYVINANNQDNYPLMKPWSLVPVNQPPSTPSTPQWANAETILHVGWQGTFQSSATDPDNDQVKIMFDWGDSTNDTSDLKPAGTTVQKDHWWFSTGMFEIKAKAIDEHGAESGWSSPLEVTVVSYENDHEWGGYITASLFPVTTISVEGEWIYPSYAGFPLPLFSAQATWIGIGGYGPHSNLLQAGIFLREWAGVPRALPFYMTLDNENGQIQEVDGWDYLFSPPSPGDLIQTKMTQVGNNQWQVYVRDVTKGWEPWMPPVFTFQPDTTTAEWIHEPGAIMRKGSSGSPIVDFKSVVFLKARVTVNGNTYKVGNVDPSQVQSELILCNMKRDTAIVTNTSPISNYETFTISDTGQRPTAVSPITSISLHSSAILSVYDSSDNHLGYNSTSGLVDMQIPDSMYFEDDQGVQYALLFDAGAYRIELIGKGNGDFHLHVQTFYEDVAVFDDWINGTTQVGKSDRYSLSVSSNGAAILTTAGPTSPVGGEWAPIDTVQMVTPWIALVFLAIAFAAAGSHPLLKKRL